MKDLSTSQANSERITQICSSLVIACNRLNKIGKELSINDKAIMEAARDLSKLYEGIDTKYIVECIKRGAMGRYGKSYGVSVHEIGLWWEKYKVEKKKERFQSLSDKQKSKQLKEIIKNQYK